VVNPNDRYTRIRERAISADPAVVTRSPGTLPRFAEAGVRCTLKHFPGLGGVSRHAPRSRSPARLTDELARSDWIPFRLLMGGGTFTMLSHARLTALDPDHPVSFSPAVVSACCAIPGLRRRAGHRRFQHGRGLASKEGVAGASIATLNAGVDLS